MPTLEHSSKQQEATELQIALVLRYRHGDGVFPVTGQKPNSLISTAIKRGFIDNEGFLTRKGRALVARYSYL